jgi:hypothetical protein
MRAFSADRSTFCEAYTPCRLLVRPDPRRKPLSVATFWCRAHLIAAEISMHMHAPTLRGPSRPGWNASLNALLIIAALLSAWVGLCAL